MRSLVFTVAAPEAKLVAPVRHKVPDALNIELHIDETCPK
jgi:hypothetical protein